MAFYENDVGILIDETKLQARVRELGASSPTTTAARS